MVVGSGADWMDCCVRAPGDIPPPRVDDEDVEARELVTSMDDPGAEEVACTVIPGLVAEETFEGIPVEFNRNPVC